ncbi:undecaprenyl-phosphate glucose phosphotransferase [Desulfovibrio sp. JC022]|uniref:undecaprenyl-phosphate glucose phosphotransferase n=1 Tax=Desulfovibrio sp. JC022 TaxID=2593642 RepID=UPI0013D304B1|nr:undecaprenyl-phosphate glucose phosphotransferase [Desulfovibrio sp. JC022]NDV21844.1 undecaprenyl-phosphate glucose phosphotransferase [Desulfovibrio sp. JC022]
MDRKIHLSPHILESLHRIVDVGAGIAILLALYDLLSPASFSSRPTHIALLAAVTAALALVSFHIAGVYKDWAGSDLVQECNRILVAVFLVFGGLLLLGYAFKVSSIYSRRVILAAMVLWPAVLCLERVFIRKVVSGFFIENVASRKAVVAGCGKLGNALDEWVNDNPWAGIRIMAFFDSADSGCKDSKPCAGALEDLPRYVNENHIQIVFVALPMRDEAMLNTLLQGLEDTTAQIYFFPDMSIFKHLMGGDVAHVAGQTAIVLRTSPFEGMNGFVKRMEDLIVSGLILFLISPFMLFIALGIKMTSKGPVFFKQWRYGLEGEPFQIYKFRTMKVLENGYTFTPATDSDPRITRFGMFLRKNSLDELPQFLNVLAGSMSIVGPRPHAVKMNEDYRKHIPGYMLRHISKPGITGLAQVNGYRGEIKSDEDMKKRISFDIEYLQNWSVLMDLKVILKTVYKFAWRQ